MDVATLRNLGRVSISPSGRYIIYQVYQAHPQTNSYSNQWILVDTLTSRSRTLIADSGSPILTYEDGTSNVTDYEDDWASFAPIWATDETLYYVRKDAGKISIHQLTLAGQDRRVSGIVGNVVDFQQTDTTHASITTMAPTKTTIAASAAAKRYGLLFFGNSLLPVDNGIPNMSLDPPKVPHYFELNLRMGITHSTIPPTQFQIAIDNNPLPAIPGITYVSAKLLAPDHRHQVFEAYFQKNGGFEHALYLVSLSGKNISALTPRSPKGIASFVWSSDSRRVLYVQQVNYINTDIFSVNISNKKPRRLFHGSTYISYCTFSQNVRFAACATESALQPPNVLFTNLTTGKSKTLSDLNPGFEQLVRGIHTQTLVWKNKWHDDFFGQLVYPRGYQPGTRYPLVILTYSGTGFQRGGSGDENPVLPLSANGFFVLNVDLGGSGGYDGNRTDGTLPILHWQSPLDGMEQIIQQLNAAGLIKQNAVGIGGLSYGAEIALYSISHSKMFQAAVSSGASARDPIFYYLKEKMWDRVFKEWGLDGPPYGANHSKWLLLSPALRAPQTNAALLMVAPDSEYLISLQEYWEMRDHHKPVELWIYSNEKHTKHQPAHRLAIYNLSLDWFSYWLQNKLDPNPLKQAQYQRWAKLK